MEVEDAGAVVRWFPTSTLLSYGKRSAGSPIFLKARKNFPSFFLFAAHRHQTPRGGGGPDRGRTARLDTMEPAVEVLRVPNMYVGAIIGQQGSKILELQRVSTARITIEKEQNDPRTITVSGTASTVAAAVNMINDTLDAEKLRLSSKRGLGHSAPGQPPANLAGAALHWQGRAPPPAGSTEIEVPVLASRCGVVIGRGGENIRDVQRSPAALRCTRAVEFPCGRRDPPHDHDHGQ